MRDDRAHDYESHSHGTLRASRGQLSIFPLVVATCVCGLVVHGAVVAHALGFVWVVQATPAHKLPVLYLLDSISKNIGGRYIDLFAQSIVSLFCDAYEVSDSQTRGSLQRLLDTWDPIFPSVKVRQFCLHPLAHNTSTMRAPFALRPARLSVPARTHASSTPAGSTQDTPAGVQRVGAWVFGGVWFV